MAEVFAVSQLTASWERVWEHVLSLERINQEMMPFFKMTGPSSNLLELALAASFGQPLFQSTVLLGGWLPAEQMRVTLADGGVTPELGWFVEQSPMRLMKQWRHERRVERLATGCRVSDSLSFGLRLPGLSPLAQPLLQAFFDHRHRWLRREFGLLVDPRPLTA